MSTKRHPNECPTCEQIPCRCAGGGSAADDEKSKKDNEPGVESKGNEKIVSNTIAVSVLDSPQVVTQEWRTHTTLLNPKNQLLHCTLFASTANQATPALSDEVHENHDSKTENTSNAESTSFSMGMKMGGSND